MEELAFLFAGAAAGAILSVGFDRLIRSFERRQRLELTAFLRETSPRRHCVIVRIRNLGLTPLRSCRMLLAPNSGDSPMADFYPAFSPELYNGEQFQFELPLFDPNGIAEIFPDGRCSLKLLNHPFLNVVVFQNLEFGEQSGASRRARLMEILAQTLRRQIGNCITARPAYF